MAPLSRRIFPLAATVSILALIAGLRASHPVRIEPRPAPTAPPVTDRVAAAANPVVECPVPLRWRIARVDSQFGLSRADAIEAVQEAAILWEDATGVELFIHDESSGFPIAFVYDGRQATAQERTRLRSEHRARRERITAEQRELEARTRRIVEVQEDHRQRLAEYNELAAGHNAVVNRWRRATRIPEPILDELTAAEERLKLEEAMLAEEGRRLEAAGDSLSEDVVRFQSTVEEHDRMGQALERVFAASPVLAARYLQLLTPDGHPLPGREIQIFQFDSASHLRLVMAHELGHAMGLRHPNDTAALMSEQHELAGAITDASVRAADLELLRARCPEL